jgi:hypothetical protein
MYAIKIFIQPMAEFVMRNSIVSRTGLKAFDNLMRKIIYETSPLKGLPKNFNYEKTKDDGLGFTKLHERYPICKIVRLAHLAISEIKDEVRREISYVAEKRKIAIDDEKRVLSLIGIWIIIIT